MDNNNNTNTPRRTLLDRLCWWITKGRVLVLILICLITVVFAFGALRIKGEVILQDMLPYDHPYLSLHARFSEVFGGGGSGAVIAIKAKNGDIFQKPVLERIKRMTDEVAMWDEVYRILTISIASQAAKTVKAKAKGEITIEPLMWPDVPQNPVDMEQLRKHLFSDPAYKGFLVARDGSSALLITAFKENIAYEKAFSLLQKLAKENTDSLTSVHLVGYPVLMGWIYSSKSQMFWIFAISILGIAVVLFLVYRNVAGMVAPLLTAAILTIWGLGFIGFRGMNFNPMLYVLAFLVGARMIGNSNQIVSRYFEELSASDNNRGIACYQTMRTMVIPNFAAVTTDAAGFAVLIIAKIVLMQHLAVIMCFWMLSIILTVFLVPAICTLIPLEVASKQWSKSESRVNWLARLMMRITAFSIGPRTRYVVGGLIIGLALICTWQMGRLKIGDTTPGSPIFYDSHPYNRDQALINRDFDASSEDLMLFYEGKPESIYEPAVLHTFEAFSRHMREKLPDIYKSSSSVINMVKAVNTTLHDGDKFWYQLPQNAELLTGLMGYVKQTVDIGTIAQYMDREMERAQITVYFSDHTSENLLRIRDAAYEFFKDNPMKLDNGEFKLAGGRIGMEIALNEEMKRSHAIIDATVLLAIFILCVVSYRSIVAGLMLTLPLIFANSIAAAYMGWKGIGLSINTLPVAAIGVGIGVDFAIYLYSRCIEEFPTQNGDWTATIMQAICTCGRAVVYTGVTIILPILSWYVLSDMKFQAEVGFFLSMIMGTNVLLTLTLHPLMIYVIKPKFISRGLALKAQDERAIGMEPEREAREC